MKYSVDNETKLKMIVGRNQVLDDGSLHMVKLSDKYLIGKVVELRSPILCALDGDKICKTCYGNLWKVNDGRGIGTYATLILTEPFTQKLLSTKHLLSVNVDDIKLPTGAEEYFTLTSDKIYFEGEGNTSVIIKTTDLTENQTHEIDKYSTKDVYVKDKRKIYKFTFKQPMILNDKFSKKLIKYFDDTLDGYRFTSKDLKEENIFKFIINNKGIADPLVDIKNSLEQNQWIDQDYNKFINYIMDKLIVSKTFICSIHIECIVREMIFFFDKNNNRISHTALLNDDIPSWKVMNVTDAILNGKSITKALLYQNIYRQLLNDSFNTFDKEGNSVMDEFLK